MPSRTTLPGSAGTGDNTGDVWTTTAIDKLPGGLCAYTNITTADIDITSSATIATCSYTAIASRMYIYVVNFGVQSSVANDIARITINDGTARKVSEIGLPVANTDVEYCAFCPPQTPSAGSITVTVTGQRSSGTGTLHVNDSGNPSPSRGVIQVYEMALSF